MNIKNNEVKIDLIKVKPKQQDVDNQGSLVKIEHIESKIVVTKFNRMSIKAKDEAMLELEKLVYIWNRELNETTGKYIYRPHRGSLEDAMKESMEFESVEQIKKYAAFQSLDAFSEHNLTLSESNGDDDRINWKNVKMLLTCRYGTQYYETPQCIGYVGTVEMTEEEQIEEAKRRC